MAVTLREGERRASSLAVVAAEFDMMVVAAQWGKDQKKPVHCWRLEMTPVLLPSLFARCNLPGPHGK